MARWISGAAGAIALLLLAGGVALAGGWATITPDDGSAQVEPSEDEPVLLGFTVLQHGQTPAPWEQPTVVVTNVTTGERLEIAATSDGADGHFSATVSFPEAGLWSWRVELADLIVDTPATTPVTVLTADGAAPSLDDRAAFRIADLAADRVRLELMEEHGARLIELQAEVEASRATIATMQARLDRAASGAPGTDAASATAAAGWHPVVVILLSVLAGAGSAFAMVVLARPSGRTATVEQATYPTTR